VDNGPEFLAHELELWAERNGIGLTFIEKGRPMQNGLIERFNRTYREEVLDAFLFEDLDQLRKLTALFIWCYNQERPHDSLLDLTPREFLLSYGQLPASYAGAREHFPTYLLDQPAA
jgi:putative transposase